MNCGSRLALKNNVIWDKFSRAFVIKGNNTIRGENNGKTDSERYFLFRTEI